jgi:hypothetical protein
VHSQTTTTRSDAPAPEAAGSGTIERIALVRRHNVCQRKLDPRSPVSVGNGEFAFTMDLTGLQSLPGRLPGGCEGRTAAGNASGYTGTMGMARHTARAAV